MRYYCHHCHTQISADELLPNFTCPSCQSGFVEEIPTQSSSSRRNSSVDESNRSGSDDGLPVFLSNRMSSDEYSDDNSDVEFLETVNGPIAQVLGLLQHQSVPHSTPLTTTTTTTISSAAQQQQQQQDSESAINNNNSNTQRMRTRSSNRAASRTAAPGAAPPHLQTPTTTYLESNPNQSLADVLNDFITGFSFGLQYPDPNSSTSNVQASASGSIPAPANRGLINIDFPLPFFLHSNPGDYAWGNAGFDAVITQLLNNLDSSNNGTPPMPKDKVDGLPTIKISNDQVKSNNVQCTVCMEDFEIGDTARQLPCEHFFHEDCIKPWLNLHASCPICRKTFVPGNEATSHNTSSGGTSETSVAGSTHITSPTINNPDATTRNSSTTTVSNVTNATPSYDLTEDDCD